MSAPDPSAVREWARRNGVQVAGRGRLPAQVVAAYTAAQRAPAAPARRLSPGPRSVNPAAAAPRPPRAAPSPADRLQDLPVEGAALGPAPASGDSRLAELAADFAALSRRFAALRTELPSATGSVNRPTGQVTALVGPAAGPTRGRSLRPR